MFVFILEMIGNAAFAVSAVSIAVTVLIRFLAIHYRWNLPKMK